MNLRKLFKNVGRISNLVSISEELDSEMIEVMKDNLSLLLDTWSLNPKIQHLRTSYSIVTTGSPTITLPSRPIHIDSVNFNFENGNVYYSLEEIDEVTYNQIKFKNVTTIPAKFVWDRNKTLSVFPIPTNGVLNLVVQNPIIFNVDDLDNEIDLPPGYETALKYSLAVLICDEFGKTDDGSLISKASEAVSRIETNQLRPMIIRQVNPFGTSTGNYLPLVNR